MKISKAVGIDLGTTRSLIGMLDGSDKVIHLWRDEFGKATVPSVVQWDIEQEKFKVGEDALLTRHKKPYPIRSIKRSMGLNVEIEHGELKMHPEEISAEILKFLKACGESLVEDTYNKGGDGKTAYILDRAIVTIPAYFSNPQIEATRKAAELAGLKTLDLLHEPTAAALYYCWKHKINDGNFLVYDLGGGTFDVSILRRSSGVFEVLGICGDMVLGGDTFDMALADYIIAQLNGAKKFNLQLDVQKDPEDKARYDYFVWRSEGIKMQLSTEQQVLFCDGACPFPDKNNNPIHVEMKITRPQFEKIIAPHVDRTINEIVKKAIDLATEKAKGTFKGIEDIDYILLVGGSTWIPYVKNTVRDRLCKKGDEPGRAKCDDVFQDEPDECVAMGAALQAAASGGIIFNDDDNNLKVQINGAAIVSNDEYHLRGSVFTEGGESEESPFNGYSLSLMQDGESYGEAQVGKDGTFGFEEIYLDSDKASRVTLILHDREQKEIGQYSRSISLGQEVGGGGETVNAQPIWLWGYGASGAKEKKILIAASDSLPAEKEIDPFKTTSPKSVTFWLYQGNVEIKKVTHVFENEIPKGTVISFSIYMDKQSNMVIRSCIEGMDPFVMELEPPPPPKPPTREDVVRMHAQFNSLKSELPSAKRRMAEQKVNNLVNELTTSLNQGDTAMAFERMAELKDTVEEITASKVILAPTRERFDETVTEARGIIGEVREELGEKADELLKNIDSQVQIAHKAYQDYDQQSLSECVAAIGNAKSFAEKKLTEKVRKGDHPPLQQIVPMLAQKLLSDLQRLKNECTDPVLQRDMANAIQDLETIPMLIANEKEAQRYIPTLQTAIKLVDKVKRILGQPVTEVSDLPTF